MALYELFESSPEQLEGKSINQLISFAGNGNLSDGNECSNELRAFLANIPSTKLSEYASQCLSTSFPNSGFALQDIVNQIGVRLGAEVTSGRYRGTPNHIGFDGLWKLPNEHAIVVEVKTTDVYRIKLHSIVNYRNKLISKNEITESKSSILLVVGRQDTGELEAQIRGSQYAWIVRIISIDALLKLMSAKEELEDPFLAQKLHEILIPREYTRLDEIAEILFSTTSDLKQEEQLLDNYSITTGNNTKLQPATFRDNCMKIIQKHLNVRLVKQSRIHYSTADKNVSVNIIVSKEYDSDTKPGYWFGVNTNHDALLKGKNSYIALGCGSAKRVLLIPYNDFIKWTPGLSSTRNESHEYCHVHIHYNNNKYTLKQYFGNKNIDITDYLITDNNKNAPTT